MFSPNERAEGAQKRIENAIHQPGEGWTSIRTVDLGIQVELDGKAMFIILPGDVNSLSGESIEALANSASKTLQQVWRENREMQNPEANFEALVKVCIAIFAAVTAIFLLSHLARAMQRVIRARIAINLNSTRLSFLSESISQALPMMASRFVTLATGLLSLAIILGCATFSLGQFVITRSVSETLLSSIQNLSSQALGAFTSSLPGLFVASFILLLAWLLTRISSDVFASIAKKHLDDSVLNAHTAPTTRRIVNFLLWLMAIAMAYPYLPGAHTEAFKGLTVIVGLMVSIGASGIVGQIAAGVMIVYTYALKQGEYIRILEHEGTVTDIGLFVVRLRTGMGEEVALPNSLVLSNVTRNFSRVHDGQGYVLDTVITIGYDTPWRQVHAMLIEAADTLHETLKDHPPFVMQTALSDFYVQYKLVVHVDAIQPATRARVASNLNAAIQDVFNHYGVQIMSPHYCLDPKTPKWVPEGEWSPAPATPHPVSDKH